VGNYCTRAKNICSPDNEEIIVRTLAVTWGRDAMILNGLLANIDTILSRITESHLSRYDYLQRSLLITNVASDGTYQSRFNGYYRMRQRSRDWYDFYFSILEREKRNSEISFREVLEEVYRAKRRVEPSFSSKLVATIRPELPVYDRYVQGNLSLAIPRQNEPAETRMRKFADIYSRLEVHMTRLVQTDAFRELKRRFDEKFSAYSHFTNVKKLDLLLWQYRQE